MDLEKSLEQDLIIAAKARDEVKLQVLRLLKAALKNYSIEVKGELTPQQMMQVLQKEAKKRHDSIDQYSKYGRQDLADKEIAELKILEQYLPTPASEEEIREAVNEAIAKVKDGKAQMGTVIAEVREKFEGAVDGAELARITREELS
ncbi:GatB/YqeY domain-containing protein [Candidatus Saccharibacteria bacterium]|nr:GatB/YqeY domain-containing protein [Candidatus Saccharibacteria bacterium]